MKASADLRKLFRSRGRKADIAKTTSLVEQGDISDRAYFVESGCLRLWYNDDGTDISLKFFLQGELCASLDSFYLRRPSKYGVEAIVPSTVRLCDRREIDDFMDQSSEFREYINSVMVHCMADYQDHFANRLSKNPEQRYRLLIEEDSELLDVVPLHYVATFLGVTPVSLSRIRKRVRAY